MTDRIVTLLMFWLALGFVLASAQNREQPPPIRPVEGVNIFKDFCAPLPRTRCSGEGACVRDSETRSSRPNETLSAEWRDISGYSGEKYFNVRREPAATRTRIKGDADLGTDLPRD